MTFTLHSPDLQVTITNEDFEGYFIEFVEWLTGEDIDISTIHRDVCEPEPGAEEEKSETETKKINNLTDQLHSYAYREIFELGIRDENFLPVSFIESFTPPPGLK